MDSKRRDAGEGDGDARQGDTGRPVGPSRPADPTRAGAHTPDPGPRRWILITVASLVALVLAAALATRLILGEERLTAALQAAVSDATDGTYRITVDDLDVGILEGSAAVTGIRMEPVQGSSGPSGPATTVNLDVERIELVGVNRWLLLTDRRLSARRLRVIRPAAELLHRDTAERRVGQAPLIDRLAAAVDWDRAPVRLGEVTVEDGRLVRRELGDPAGSLTTVDDIDVTISDVELEGRAVVDSTRVLFSSRIDLTIGQIEHVDDDSLHVLRAGPIRLASADSSLTVDSARYVPTLDEAGFLRHAEHRTTRYEVLASGFETHSLDVRELLHGRAARAGVVIVDRLDADILLDKRLPAGPDVRHRMPGEALRELGREVAIDSIRLKDASIVYGEHAADGVRPGRVRFAPLTATLTRLYNDSTRTSADSPAVLTASTRIEGEGPLHVTLGVPLVGQGLDLSFSGRMEGLHAPALNSILEPLDGISIESGEVRSITFEGGTRNGVSTGALTAIYDDLSIRTFDKRDGDQSVGQWIESFIANTFKIRGSNLPEDGGAPPERGRIEYVHAPDQPFFAFLWATVRSGLLSQIGL